MRQRQQSAGTFNFAGFRRSLLVGCAWQGRGFLQCLFGVGAFDLGGGDGSRGEDRDDGAFHLDEAAVDEEGFFAGGGRRLEFSVAQAAGEGCSAGEDSDLSVEQRKPQRRRRLIEHRSLGSHDHQLQLFVSHVHTLECGVSAPLWIRGEAALF